VISDGGDRRVERWTSGDVTPKYLPQGPAGYVMSSGTIYTDEDAEEAYLDDRTVAVVGYGNQGRSQARNLRDSGVDVVVGNRDDDYRAVAREDGFDVLDIPDAVARGDVVVLLVPDEVAPDVYAASVEPDLSAGDVLCFSHGYNVSYHQIEPPETVDVVLVAPRMGGWAVRSLYESGDGFPSILAVHRDASGEAKDVALAYAHAIGSTKAGVVEGTFDMETITDLLTEQALIPMIMAAFQAKFQVERAYGIPEEIILAEQYLSGEFGEIFDAMAREGYLGQLPNHSRTSQYGQLSRFDAFDVDPLVDFADAQLRAIDNGAFVREWSTEQSLGRPGLKRLYERVAETDYFRAERRTRERLFPDRETE